MSKINTFFSVLNRFKYHLVILISVIWIGFLDDTSVVKRIQNGYKIELLKEEIQEYETKYEDDIRKIDQLNSDARTVEKVAREKYFMKRADEDIFILSDD
ncbi:MAG: septum formation initiator family protein [Prevotella sp.]|nr:septum formation initiator family protein [Prevotella sp.]